MRVLIVEDQKKLAALLKRGFEREGMAVDVIGDGAEAVWRAQATAYDAIVMDVMLPGPRRLQGVPADPRGGCVVTGPHADRA